MEQRPKTALAHRVNVGFESIKLDPSPNLPRNRVSLFRPRIMATAWENVAIALKRSIEEMEANLSRKS